MFDIDKLTRRHDVAAAITPLADALAAKLVAAGFVFRHVRIVLERRRDVERNVANRIRQQAVAEGMAVRFRACSSCGLDTCDRRAGRSIAAGPAAHRWEHWDAERH